MMKHSPVFLVCLVFPLLSQDGARLVAPTHVHQYSYSPLSVANDKLHNYDLSGHAQITRVSDGGVIRANAPYPDPHWDGFDDDKLWIVGRNTCPQSFPTVCNNNKIETWRPSTGAYATVVNYTARFSKVQTGGSSDLTYDGWIAFFSDPENTVCAVNIGVTPVQTYCLNYNTPDPANHVGSTFSGDVDYVAMTPKDSVSGLHYIVMAAVPAMAVFSVDEANNTLHWVVRPEANTPYMGVHIGEQNNDGICDAIENCITTPHGDILAAIDGQVYFVFQVGMQGTGLCAEGMGMARLNAGVMAFIPENLGGVSGGALKFALDYNCGTNWSSAHIGCARFGQHCAISFDTPNPQGGSPKNEEIWLLGLNPLNAVTYSRVGASNSSITYYSQSRAAMSIDGAEIVYDSDAGTHGASQAVYELASGLAALRRPTPANARFRGGFRLRGNWRVR